MNLDELISKYIDAELAPEEDGNLREFISESEKARDIFDRSVGIHLAIREDAHNIMPPKDLVRETESKVMMQIMALKAEPAPVVHKINGGRVRFYQMAAAAVVMFLVGVITISDLNIINRFGFNELARLNPEEGLSRNYYIDEAGTMAPLGDGIQTIEMPRERFVPGEKASESAQIPEQTYAYSQSSEISRGNSAMTPGAPALPAVLFENSSLAMGLGETKDMLGTSSDNRIGNSLPMLSMNQALLTPPASNKTFSSAMHSNMQKSGGQRKISLPGDLGFDIGMVHSIVNITSHFGTDVARFGFDNAEKSSVSHFSQAIAFSLDESNYLGVELGYTQYTCKDKILVKISTGGGSETEGKDPSSGEIPPQYQVTPKSVSNNKQLLWCVGFWEYNFLASGDFALDTRIGLGASAEGPLGLSRLMTRYELVKGLFLSVGVEGRAFRANMEELSNSKATIKSSVSIVYGLQLKF